jgi:hypothetical protein
MTIFTIDSQDRITTIASSKEVDKPSKGPCLSSAAEFQALTESWPASRLVRIWNQLPAIKPVKKFTNRKTAVARIWKAIEDLDVVSSVTASKVTDKKPSRNRTQAPHENTKAAQIIALCREPSGATLQALMQATGWQAHSVRGFLSRHLRKKLGLRLKSFRRSGERVYVIR